MSATLTITELVDLLRKCGGDQDLNQVTGDIASTPFTDLGYDSLTVQELANHIERAYGIALPDDVVAQAPTPEMLLSTVNDLLLQIA